MTSLRFVVALISLMLAVIHSPSFAADDFAPAWSKATLTVEYLYESTGKVEDKYDRHEWQVKRTVKLTTELVSRAPSPLPTMQELDAAQSANLQSKSVKAQAVANDMAPLMANAEKIMATCGDDEACIARETQKLGFAMQGTKEHAAAQKAGKNIQEISDPGALRYQVWSEATRKGTYVIDETARLRYAEMGAGGCANLPGGRCNREEIRKGGGDIQLPAEVSKKPMVTTGASGLEIDSVKKTMAINLPVAMVPLPYTETVKSDDPDPSKKGGTAQKLAQFRVTADGKANHDKPLVVALKGGWRTQSGEYVVNTKGGPGDAGKLTVRWRFAVQ